MKKQIAITIISVTLLVSSMGVLVVPFQAVITNESRDSYLPSSEPLERVYGEDHSWDVWKAISQSFYTNYVKKISENGSRWIQAPDLCSQQNTDAQNYITNELEQVSNGRIEVETIGEYRSIVGRLPGYLPIDGPAFLVGGHYDSVPRAPGANDDASGVAAMLEIARVMSEYEWPLDIYFGAWNAEEIGLFGSREVAREFNNRSIDILVYYNVDMLLVPDSIERNILMVYPVGSYNEGRYWADLTAQMSGTYGNGRIEPLLSTEFDAWQRSDHWSFIQEGYGSSLFAFESGGPSDIWYHQPGDVWYNEAYDYVVATEAVKSIAAAIAFTQARAFEKPVLGLRSFVLQPSQERNIYITITGETTINVSSRWYGGGSTYNIFDPDGYLVDGIVFDTTSPWEPSVILEVPVSKQGIYRLCVYNHQGTSVGYDLSWMYDTDINDNDILDSEEFWFDVGLFSTDTDSDLLSDAYEMIIGTNWQSADTDQDVLQDKWELDYGLDPLDPTDALSDNDGDTLTNRQEFVFGSNPLLTDSDSDELPDLWEFENGLSPIVDDSAEDPDNDQMTNLEEYRSGTDPNVAEPRHLNFVPSTLILMGSIFVLVLGSFIIYRKR